MTVLCRSWTLTKLPTLPGPRLQEGIYIDSELVATTGVRLYVGATEWLCTIRGIYLGSLSAEFKCLTVTSNFLYTPDQLAYTGCYSSTEV